MTSTRSKQFDFLSAGLRAIARERQAVQALEKRLNYNFTEACSHVMKCKGKVVVLGIGKSGHIAKKTAATLASTGTPAFFIHAAEAGHGDLGMISSNDVVLVMSNSGASPEVIGLLPLFKRLGVMLIAMTGKTDSPLAKAANTVLDTSVSAEACPLDLSPTSSTTVSLVLGDALAVALLEARGFTHEDFAFSHPSGSLGRKLLLRIDDLVLSNHELPLVRPKATLGEALEEISEKGLGMTCVVDNEKKLLGVFTDGDLRRAIAKKISYDSTLIFDVMTDKPAIIHPSSMAIEALRLMQDKKITVLPVVDDQQRVQAILHMHDLIRAGLE